MTRNEAIEFLQDQVQHNRISIEDFVQECEKYDLDGLDEVLLPIGYNICDRCGNYGDSELDLCWLDYLSLDEKNKEDRAIMENISKEGIDYTAICWNCLEKLKKGEGNENN